MDERGFQILNALDTVAKEYNTVPATIAIAWFMAQRTVAAVPASATGKDQLKALTDAAGITLSNEAKKVLNDASAWGTSVERRR